MKVLVIPSWYPSTKANYEGVFIKEQVKALKETGLDISVLFGNYQYQQLFVKSSRSFQKESGINSFRGNGFFLPKLNEWIIDRWAQKHFPLFEDYLEKFERPDLIHAHSYMAGAIAFQIAQHYDIPYVLTEHLFRFLTGDVRKRHQKLVTKVYNGASQLIAVSTALQNKMQAYTNTEIRVIPNLVDTQRFKIGSRIEKLPQKVFISVGNLNKTKGYDLLIKAFKNFKLREKGNTILKIIGDGKLKSNLEGQIQHLGLSQEVFLLGALSQENIIQELQRADCFISSSRVETFGVAIIEAMSVGLPVIATKCGGPEEIVKKEQGQLIPANDVLALSNAIFDMKIEKYDSTRIRAYVEGKFSKKIITHKLISFYKNEIENLRR